MDPVLRASDQDRRQVITALERHTAAGRLNLDEYEERVSTALSAVTLGDLAAIIRDLPAEPDRTPAAPDRQDGARHLLLAFVLAALTIVVLAVLLAIAR